MYGTHFKVFILTNSKYNINIQWIFNNLNFNGINHKKINMIWINKNVIWTQNIKQHNADISNMQKHVRMPFLNSQINEKQNHPKLSLFCLILYKIG